MPGTVSGSPIKSNKRCEYYVVDSEHLVKPAIYSSWGRVQALWAWSQKPSCDGHATFAKAVNASQEKGITDFDIIVKSTTENTSPALSGPKFYAVANGRKPGVKEFWDGPGGAGEAVEDFPEKCVKKFATDEQAEECIEDWNDEFARRHDQELRKALRDGWRPVLEPGEKFTFPLRWRDPAGRAQDAGQGLPGSFNGLNMRE